MEQDITATIPVMDSGKQKDGKGWKIATAIASVVAVCGIGFGVYGILQSSQKDSQISDLKVQVEDSNGKITTLETEKIETTDENGTTITIADSAVKNENTKDYVYIGEWGIKIKVPKADRFREFSYAFAPSSLYLWGAKTVEQPQATTAFGVLGDWNGRIVNNTFLGKVSKEDASFFTYCEAQNRCGTKIMELDDDSTLVWFDSESAMSAYDNQQDYDGQLQESIDILKAHFTNSDNYSTI